MDTLRLAGVVRQSIVDGPGLRFVVFTQGCPHRCPGCHNPATHDFSGGYDCPTGRVLEEIDRDPLLKGVTFSGGEPFCQAAALAALAEEIHRRGKDIYCFTGYTFEELLDMAAGDEGIASLLEAVDVLVDGRFLAGQRDLSLPLGGSANQRVLDLPASLRQGAPVLHPEYVIQGRT